MARFCFRPVMSPLPAPLDTTPYLHYLSLSLLVALCCSPASYGTAGVLCALWISVAPVCEPPSCCIFHVTFETWRVVCCCTDVKWLVRRLKPFLTRIFVAVCPHPCRSGPNLSPQARRVFMPQYCGENLLELSKRSVGMGDDHDSDGEGPRAECFVVRLE